jgi:hypothetical protein
VCQHFLFICKSKLKVGEIKRRWWGGSYARPLIFPKQPLGWPQSFNRLQ